MVIKKLRLYNIIYLLVFLTAELPLIVKRMKGYAIFVSIIWLILLTQCKKISLFQKEKCSFFLVFLLVINNLALLLWHLHLSRYNKLPCCRALPLKISHHPNGSLQCLTGDRWLLKAAPIWTFHSLWYRVTSRWRYRAQSKVSYLMLTCTPNCSRRQHIFLILKLQFWICPCIMRCEETVSYPHIDH